MLNSNVTYAILAHLVRVRDAEIVILLVFELIVKHVCLINVSLIRLVVGNA